MGHSRSSVDVAGDLAWPMPDVSAPDFAGYWEACAQGHLVVRRCNACSSVSWPPRPRCPVCGAADVRWFAVAPRGTVFSWTTVYRTPIAAFASLTPYVVSIIELEETPHVRMVGRVADVDPSELRIGAPVVATFDVFGGVSLPVWHPAG